jgi:alkanesulfonate monooxygenase SsuD/methylene tetrahydromethanopterin reductase-like flavin-dependent oxidoreductase (luciferase family)
VVALPVIVTDDAAHGREQTDKQLARHGRLPIYRAVLDREGVEGPGDVAVVGDEASVSAQLERFRDIGATDFVASLSGDENDRRRTLEHLASII